MLFKTALRIIIYEKEKFSGAVAGVAVATFLMILQCGFYLGYRRDITVVLDSIDADIWFVPKNQPLFDGWMAMDDLPYYQAKGHPDIAKVARLAWGYAPYRIPSTGGKDTTEVLGVEFDSGIGLRLNLDRDDLASRLRPDGHVMVGRKDCEKLGITAVGEDGIEIYRQACHGGRLRRRHPPVHDGRVRPDRPGERPDLPEAARTPTPPTSSASAAPAPTSRRSSATSASNSPSTTSCRPGRSTTAPPTTGRRGPASARC